MQIFIAYKKLLPSGLNVVVRIVLLYTKKQSLSICQQHEFNSDEGIGFLIGIEARVPKKSSLEL